MWEVSGNTARLIMMGPMQVANQCINMSLVTEAGPSAFANIKENYYYVFVGCSLFFLIVAYFYFP